MLAALAAVNVMVAPDDAGAPRFHVGIEWLAVGACLAVVVWRRNLLLGLLAAVAIVVVARGVGPGGDPGLSAVAPRRGLSRAAPRPRSRRAGSGR